MYAPSMTSEEDPEDIWNFPTKAHFTKNQRHKLRKKLSRLGKVGIRIFFLSHDQTRRVVRGN